LEMKVQPMNFNKPLFASFVVFALMLISMLVATFMFDSYRITWPHYAAFGTALAWYGVELHRSEEK